MIITKPGKYRLTRDYNHRTPISVDVYPAGRVLNITHIDNWGKKVFGPDLLDWAPWDMPVEPVE